MPPGVNGRPQASGAAGQYPPPGRHRPDDAAARNHARAHRSRLHTAQIEDWRNLVQELSNGLDRRSPPAAKALRKTDLESVGARHDPADVPRREVAVDKAVEHVGLRNLYA